jgi:hypothetical protein
MMLRICSLILSSIVLAGAISVPALAGPTLQMHSYGSASYSAGGVTAYAAASSGSLGEGSVHHAAGFGAFVGGQFVLWLLGLGFAGLIFSVAARAARNVSINVRRRPLVYGLVGGAAAFGLKVVFWVSSGLAHLPIGLLFIPLKAAAGGALLLFLAYGWVCSMATLGAQLGHTAPTVTTWFKNASRGLTLCLGFNILLGALGMGGVALTVQLVFALVGCGSALFSRFGVGQLPLR